ncbi:glycosyltransferase family 32 protein [Pseudalkalibacillus sp. SCS-8]|uniref:glycosyltransferase family 32 protein n=1 Tax=Pseudalkalibacillus nanhaiensis TaxID=3115291 RepID=UPI0032DAB228
MDNVKYSIPKKIHYCWFGGYEKPTIVSKCLESWKDKLDGYELIEWNERNFDIEFNQYVKEAYRKKKYAFVSDYVRLYALNTIGGIYLDTDVEVLKPFDDLLNHQSFWGFEQENFIATSTFGAKKSHPIIQQLLDSYEERPFVLENGKFDSLTNVAMITRTFQCIGVKLNGAFQEPTSEITIYPQTYFSPYDYINCRYFTNDETYTIHHFHKSWLKPSERMKSTLKKSLSKVIGGDNLHRMRTFVTESRNRS